MTERLTENVQWIDECYDLGQTHKHISVYLIREGNRYILVDSGSFYHRDAIKDSIEKATNGQGIDALILSHSDYPHSANISEFRPDEQDVELIASSGTPAAQGLSNATKCEIGGSMEIVGRSFSFIDPPLADRSHTTWIYDHNSETLFTSDGFGNRHQPGECDLTSADMENGIQFEDIYEFHKKELVWLRYVDPEKLCTALESIFEQYPIRYIAPIHGNPIAGDDLNRYMERLIDAVNQIAGEYTVPTNSSEVMDGIEIDR